MLLGFGKTVLNLLAAAVQLLLGFGEFIIQLLFHPGVESVNFVLTQPDGNALFHIAAGGHAGHAFNALQFGHQFRVQQIGKGSVVHAVHFYGGNGNGQHTGVDLHDVGRAHHIVPAAGDRIELLPNIRGKGIHIGVIGELEHNLGGVLLGDGVDLLHMIQRSHSLLNGPGDLLLYLFRSRAGIGCDDHGIGQIDVGKKVRGHPGKSHGPQDQSNHNAHKNGHGLLNAESGKHGDPFFL